MSTISEALDVSKPPLKSFKSLSPTDENPEQNVADLFETLDKQALKSISKLNASVSSHEYLIYLYRN